MDKGFFSLPIGRREQVIEEQRRKFPKGLRVRLIRMEDAFAPPVGSEGTVCFVDDAASVHVAWDKGGSLAALYGVDIIEPVVEK